MSGKVIASGENSCFQKMLWFPFLGKIICDIFSTPFDLFFVRPLAAWKNSAGRYEISRETVSVDEEAVELKLVNLKSEKSFFSSISQWVTRFHLYRLAVTLGRRLPG